MTIDRWITDAATLNPDKTALIFGDEALSYGRMADRITVRANWLTASGVARGDRVAWYGMNHAEVFILLFACARIGAIFVPLNWRLTEQEIAEIVTNCAPKLLICDQNFKKYPSILQGIIHVNNIEIPDMLDASTQVQNVAEDDPLLLVYTSGSTGKPKGVVLSQQALITNATMSVEAHGLTSDDTVLNVLPLFHVGGLNILPTPAFSIGATVELHEKFDPFAACIALERVDAAILVPTVLQAMMQCHGWADTDFTRPRVVSIGSTDVPIKMISALHAKDVSVIQVYGATETAPFAIYQTVAEARTSVGSIGRAGSLCDIRLVQDGFDVTPGTPGEIWVKGGNTLLEYWRDPLQSGAQITDGWFHTGDVARCDESGLYWFVDRIKHVIISGGENIYPAEIERVLRTHPLISEVAVVGRPDPKWGEVPVAVIVGAGLDKTDVLAHLDGQIARYKRPKDAVFVKMLPRNAMGKVVTAEVRKLV